MPAQIDYFYTLLSPWAYLGHEAFLDITKRYGATVTFRPVGILDLFEQTGGLPPGKRHPVRQAYRFIELQRWKEKRGLPLTFKPAFFPTNISLAERCAVVLQERGEDVGSFSQAIFEAVWVNDEDAANEEVVAKALKGISLDASEILKQAQTAEIGTLYKANNKLAVELGVIGSPAYVLKGEPFWGQDRLDLLEDALASDRKPYKPL